MSKDRIEIGDQIDVSEDVADEHQEYKEEARHLSETIERLSRKLRDRRKKFWNYVNERHPELGLCYLRYVENDGDPYLRVIGINEDEN